VDFYQGSTLLGTATGSSYSVTASKLAAGAYTLTAVATDSDGAQTTSAAVSFVVNAVPTVSLKTPANNAKFNAPANIPITADPADPDGMVSSVSFYYGTTLITTLSAPPYSFIWSEVPQGTYVLTAQVTDNFGATVASEQISVTVNSPVAKLYYIHVDHLNTPRAIFDDNHTPVWRWSPNEPFGNNPADDNPNGVGKFPFPLRFPGQYFDEETGLGYNYFRDYSPDTGRYVQSDPIGLLAGMNTYSYVIGNPLRYADPRGLDETVWESRGGRGIGDGPRNGNWCGKNWSGGWVPALHSGLLGPYGATDSLDTCCKAHDLCWEDCERLKTDPKRYMECRYKCDKGIVKCLKELDADCTKWPRRPREGTEADSQIFADDAHRFFAEEVRKYEARTPVK
jgi:RHS repeat-associated protein